MIIPPTTLLEIAVDAAKLATEQAQKYRREHSFSVSMKGDFNLVTSADLASEKVILEHLKKHLPEHKILSEESAQTSSPEDYGKGYTWVIDPIDGTTNYAHDHFHVGLSIACALNGETVAAAVAAPFLDEIFTATKGGGAFLNGKPIKCKQTTNLSDALITTGFPYSRANAHNICARLERILPYCRDIRRLGAASLDLCWVGCGRLDAYYEECIQSWDAAAGVLIAREAGCIIDHFAYDSDLQKMTARYSGDLFADNIVACVPGIHAQLMSILNR